MLLLAEGEAAAPGVEVAALLALAEFELVADWSGVLLLAEGEAVAPAPGVLVAVSPEALGLVPVVLALPALALCEAAAFPLISGLLLVEAVLLGVEPVALGLEALLEAAGVDDALCEDMPLIEPAEAPVPAAAAALGLLPELLQFGEMELTLET